MRFLLLLLTAALAWLPLGARAQGAWQPLDSHMADGRWAPAAVLLADGHTALIAGGYSYATKHCVASADLFDETTRTFRPCKGAMNDERDFATATLLPGGLVLIAGGFNTHTGSLDTAELYDPKTQQFTPLPSRLSRGRELFQATALADGRVLLSGGLDLWTGRTQNSADLFDPKTGTFTPTRNPMQQDRFGHAAVRLVDGRVLIVGGKSVVLGTSETFLASAEIFDPRTGRFHTTQSPMHVPRDRPTATLLPGGAVLIAGGQDGDATPTQAELFHPKTETFTLLPTPMASGRMAHGAAALPDGRVLLAGGWDASAQASVASTELFDPQTNTFAMSAPLPQAVLDAALIAFPDGIVLCAGGKTVASGQASSSDAGAFLDPSIYTKSRGKPLPSGTSMNGATSLLGRSPRRFVTAFAWVWYFQPFDN